jgi:hypothetical protein
MRPEAEGAGNGHAIRFKCSDPILAAPGGTFRADSGAGIKPGLSLGYVFLATSGRGFEASSLSGASKVER